MVDPIKGCTEVNLHDRELVSVLEVRIELGNLNPRPKTPQSVTLPTIPRALSIPGYFDSWSGFEAAKTAPWPSRGLHHCGKFLEPSGE